jgi:hypothetical protein
VWNHKLRQAATVASGFPRRRPGHFGEALVDTGAHVHADDLDFDVPRV